MPTTLGIHLQPDFLLVALADCSPSEVTLCQWLALPDPFSQDSRSLLASSLRKWHVKPHKVFASLCAHQAILRKFSVPFSQLDHIDQIVHYEAEKYIPSLPIDDLLIDYLILQKRSNNTRLLVAAFPQNTIASTLAFLKSCDISPIGLELDLMALLHAAQAIGLAKPFFTLLDLQLHACNILLAQHGNVLDARAFPLKPQFLGLPEHLADTVELDLSCHTPSSSLSPNAISKIHSLAARELTRTLLSSPGEGPLYLSGNPQLLEGFPAFLLSHHNIQSSPWPWPSHLLQPLPQGFSSYLPIPLGLAIRAATTSKTGFDFRKAAFSYSNYFDLLKIPLAICLSALFLLLVLCHLCLISPSARLRAQCENNLALAYEIFSTIDPSLPPLAQDCSNPLASIAEALQARLDERNSVPPILDSLILLHRFCQKLHILRQSHLFTVHRFYISQTHVTIEGAVQKPSFFDECKREFSLIPHVDTTDGSFHLLEFYQIASPSNPNLSHHFSISIRLLSPQ